MKFGVPELEDLGDVSGKSVLVRADFNVPLSDGVIGDDLRIRAALPTLQWLTEHGASVTACTHLGRPKGAPDPAYSVDPVRARLSELAPGVELLDNLRFDAGETANDPAFVDRLIAGHDMYVNDAFGASHRAHASIVGPPSKHLPSAAGRLLAKEVEVLLGVREDPTRPFVAITGGSKVSDKLGVLTALLEIADSIIIGGGMCFTFFAGDGSFGSATRCASPTRSRHCAQLLDEHGDRLHLPSDVVGLGPGGKIGDPVRRRRGPQLRALAARRLDGPGHRPRHGRRVRRHHRRGPHDPVERPDGRVRGSPLRGRHPSRRRGRGRQPGLLGHRRRRLRRGDRTVRSRRPRSPHLHRRRRVARADRAGRPARAWTALRSPPNA
jgi:hypothetical protein